MLPLHSFSSLGVILPSRTLTLKQQTVLDFLRRYFDANRRSPLIREIQAGCQILSYKSALDRLNALERKGLIRRLPNKHRGIKLLKRQETAAVAEVPRPAPVAAEGPSEPAGAVAP